MKHDTDPGQDNNNDVLRFYRYNVGRTTNDRFYMTDKRIVLTTAGTKEEAHKIARGLVERRLAACVNIVPQVESVYRWQGNVEEASEWLLVIKTTAAAFARVREAIRKLHSYDLPECVCLAVEDGSDEYLKWVGEQVLGS